MASDASRSPTDILSISLTTNPLNIVFPVCLLLAFLLLHWRRKSSPTLPDLPWVARNDRAWVLCDLRTRLWCSINYEEALRRAYDQYARHNKPCILATLDGEVVLLPPSNTSWLIAQPDNVLSVNGAHKHILQTRYTFPKPEIMDPTVHFGLFPLLLTLASSVLGPETWHFLSPVALYLNLADASCPLLDVIKSELTRQVFNVTPEVCDELAAAVDQIWGSEADPDFEYYPDADGWKTVVLFDSLTKIIARISNRVFVGLPLCRDEEYLKNAIGFAEDIAFSATILRLFPGILRPLVSRIVTSSNRKHTRAYTEILTPEILRRQGLQDVTTSDSEAEHKNSETERPGDTAKNDFLQWLLTRSLTKSYLSPDEADPQIICARLLHVNFASVHTTSFIGTNALLDILAAPRNERVLETLRQEAWDNMEPDAGSGQASRMWSRTAIAKMHYLDSALRESSRRASIIGVGVNQKVVAPGGITTPDGIHVPEGCMVATHSWGCHNDETLYEGADKYKAFRFVELRDRVSSGLGDGDRDRADREKEYLDKAHLSFIATSPSYLGFGHGRHACPGRFFAAQELKLLLAYLLSRYEIQMVMEGGLGGNWNGKGIRPECYWAGPNHVPPMSAKVRVRRRKEFQ
ncbi:cytochrome P450 [Fonsecaea pedrosoi]|nr:cytochrome P450 [Fonsecaea pedrosoi]